MNYSQQVNKENVPQHIAIIMDGNGRWAQQRGLARTDGHQAGAVVVKKIAEDYGAYFVPLQEKFDEAAQKYGVENYLYDGVHPAPAGAKLIATEWLKKFKEIK